MIRMLNRIKKVSSVVHVNHRIIPLAIT